MLKSRPAWPVVVVVFAVLALCVVAIVQLAPQDESHTAGVMAPFGSPAPESENALPPPSVALEPLPPAHQGFPYTVAANVASPAPGPLTAWLEMDDGREFPLDVGPGGRVELSHVFAGAGWQRLKLYVEGPTGQSTATARLEVIPRKVVFIQGMNSESACPDGKHFVDRAPRWLAHYFAADPALREQLALEPDAYAYFSYSGRYCDDAEPAFGAAPDYHKGHTCKSIADSAAPRLKALIESLAPARVTVVAHSMGGLVTAYLAGTEPEWAREHIASVATFDSPLGGVDIVRRSVLSLFRVTHNGCGPDTPAIRDIQSGSAVTRAAASAGGVVPFFTLDGESGESHILGTAEAVPGPSTRIDGSVLHMQVREEHSEVWSREPNDDAALDKHHFVGCAVLRDAAPCLARP